jgi:hypothetical protein
LIRQFKWERWKRLYLWLATRLPNKGFGYWKKYSTQNEITKVDDKKRSNM